MDTMGSPAVASKAKAMYGNRLKKEDYEELVRKNSVGEVASYLKNETDYGSTLKDIYENKIHRGQLEALIRENIFRKALKILKFAQLTKNEFYRLNLIQREIDIILMAIRSIIPEKHEELEEERRDDLVKGMPLFLSDYITFEMSEIPNIKSFSDVLKILDNTPYHEILVPYNVEKSEKLDYTALERDLQSYYYGYVFRVIEKTFKGKRKNELMEMYKTQIELSNIIKIYRYKKFFKVTDEEIRKAMIDSKSRLSKAVLDELIALPTAEDILKALEESKYHLYVDDQDYVYIEYYANEIRYNLAKRYMHFSIDAPMIYTSYVILLDIEVQNLTNIIEGIRYETPKSEIEKMLIY